MTNQSATAVAAIPPANSRGRGSFRRLVGLLAPFRRRIWGVATVSVLIIPVKLMIPALIGRSINDIQHHHHALLTQHIWLIVAAGAIVMALNAARRIIAGGISLGLEKQLRDRLFVHLSGLNHRFFDQHQTGQLLSRATIDVTQVRFFLGYGLPFLFLNAATLIGVPIAMFLLQWQLSLIAMAAMPLILLVSGRYSRRSYPILREVQQRDADVTTAAEENIVGARVVRAFGQEESQIAHFRALTDRVVGKERESYLLSSRYVPMYDLIPNIALAAVVLVGAYSVRSGSIGLGDLFAFYSYLQMLVAPLRSVGMLVGRSQRATASSDRLHELLFANERLPLAAKPQKLAARRSGIAPAASITLESIRFSYVPEHPVIEDVSLEIPAGSTVAILGPTGCGKTTLASLVPRFYDPDSGTVRVDGIDVRDLDLADLRTSVGMVSEEPFLFSASVRDNIRFGAPRASDNDVWDALEAAQARGFVERLPDGLDTMIGERGLTLSGGQRQRLAIARALTVHPRILILDDATASVDSRVEREITGALRDTTAATTTILIAHRPSTIALADHIVMLDEGRITAQGTHAQLMAKNEFYQLIQSQTSSRREFLIDPVLDGEGADAAAINAERPRQ